jgi:transposase
VCRAGATRFDKLAVRYEAAIHIAVIDIWLRALTNTTF